MIVVLGMLILVALTGGGLMQDKPILEAIQEITVGAEETDRARVRTEVSS